MRSARQSIQELRVGNAPGPHLRQIIGGQCPQRVHQAQGSDNRTCKRNNDHRLLHGNPVTSPVFQRTQNQRPKTAHGHRNQHIRGTMPAKHHDRNSHERRPQVPDPRRWASEPFGSNHHQGQRKGHRNSRVTRGKRIHCRSGHVVVGALNQKLGNLGRRIGCDHHSKRAARKSWATTQPGNHNDHYPDNDHCRNRDDVRNRAAKGAERVGPAHCRFH